MKHDYVEVQPSERIEVDPEGALGQLGLSAVVSSSLDVCKKCGQKRWSTFMGDTIRIESGDGSCG